jgi:hypothetical protein
MFLSSIFYRTDYFSLHLYLLADLPTTIFNSRDLKEIAAFPTFLNPTMVGYHLSKTDSEPSLNLLILMLSATD